MYPLIHTLKLLSHSFTEWGVGVIISQISTKNQHPPTMTQIVDLFSHTSLIFSISKHRPLPRVGHQSRSRCHCSIESQSFGRRMQRHHHVSFCNQYFVSGKGGSISPTDWRCFSPSHSSYNFTAAKCKTFNIWIGDLPSSSNLSTSIQPLQGQNSMQHSS